MTPNPSSTKDAAIKEFTDQEYKYGFVTDLEADAVPPGLNEDVIRLISAKKNEPEWLLEWRLKAYRHWLTMTEPTLAKRALSGHRLPGHHLLLRAEAEGRRSNSLDEVDPELLEMFEKLGIPLKEQKRLAGVAVDAVFDSVSVGTTFKEKLAEAGHHLLLLLRSRAGTSRPGAANISARSCRTRTIFSRRSTPPSSPTGRSATSRRACAVRWSCPPISASTPRTPASSSAR